jgi:hypothetical protein
MGDVILTRFSQLAFVRDASNVESTRYLRTIALGVVLLKRTNKWCD